MVNWTEQQQQAINLRNTEILVTAAAGSGKTATLIERIINILSDEQQNVQCENLLVTTFTNAAAGEVKEKIRKALRERIIQDSSNLYIYNQYKNISRATISTLHSFCSEIIRKNSSLIDIDPGFSIADESISDKFLLDAVNAVYEEYLNKQDILFNKVLSTFGYGKNFNALTDIIISVIRTIKSYPDYEKWLKESADNTLINEDKILSSVYGKEIRLYIERKLNTCFKYIEDLQCDIYDNYEFSHYEKLIEEDISIINSVLKNTETNDWDMLKSSVEMVKFANLPRKKKDFDESVVDKIKDCRDKVKKTFLLLKYQLYDSESNIKKDCLYMYEIIKKVVEIILRTDEIYTVIKSKAKLIDYADMEHMALKCLKAGAYQIYKEKYKHILIDEYQDFNYVQESIINLISKNNVFAVGDIKQSIYRFRNAQTAIFKNKSELFKKDSSKGSNLNLSFNFRSRDIILDYVNGIFSNIMTEELGEVQYGNNEKLQYGAVQYLNQVQDNNYLPTVIKIQYNQSDSNLKNKYSQVETEAYIIAQEIIKLIDSRLIINDSISGLLRPVKMSDIVILMRSVNNYVKTYCDILNKCGIPVYAEQNIEFMNNQDISDLFALLNIVDNPYQEIYLAQIMKNKLYNFDECEFVLIKKNNINLYESLLVYDTDDSLYVKIKRLLQDINDIRLFAKRNSVEKIVYYAMTKSGLYYISTNQDLLKRFYVLSVDCYKKGIDDLYGFIRFLKSKNKKDLTVISSIMGSENSNAVNIMSIHKSKGLEFPVVILSGCSRGFNIDDIKRRLIIDRELGIGSEYINSDIRTYHKHITKNALSLNIKRQNLSEEMRILYVALTRAKEKLIITGIDKNASYAIVADDAKNFFDWIIPNTDEALIKTVTENECINIVETFNNKSIPVISAEEKIHDHAYYQNILMKIGFKYPYIEETKLNRKVSATELSKYQSKNYSIEEFYDTYRVSSKKLPLFMENIKKSIDASKKGTIMHKIMASIDLKRLNDPEYIYFLKSKVNEQEYIDNIVAFISSSIFNDICKADEIYQEKVFFMPVSTSYIASFTDQKFKDECEVLMQGVIDCLIIKDGYGIIIDYKTDKVKKGKEKEHALRYKTQMDIYSDAVERIMGVKVKSKIIYFFKTNTNIDLNLL